MQPLHSLLKRQLKRYLGSAEAIPPEFEAFVQAVNEACCESDRDRGMLERSLELSSQELIQANSDIRAVLQAFPDLFFWLDENDVIVDCKAGDPADVYPALGGLVGKRLQSIPIPEVAAKFQEAVQQVRATRQLVSIEYDLPVGDHRRFYEARLLPILGTKIIAIVRNISERKKAEASLREAEEKYRMQFEGALDAIVVADAETGILIDCNPAAARLVERERSELIGQHQRILHPAEQLEGEFTRTFKQHLKEKEGHVLETQVVTKRGEKKDVAITTSQFETGGRTVMQGIFRDITERKRAEEALRESEERFRGLVEKAPDVIYTLSADATITSLSPVFEKTTGWSREEWLGRSFGSLIHPEDLPVAMETFQAALRGENPPPYQLRVRAQSGEYLVGEFTSCPLMEKGAVVGELGIARDITERKRAEEALRRSEEQLRQSQKMEAVGRLAGGVAHDFNNLLTAILGFSRLVLDRVNDPEIRMDVEEIIRSGERAARLTSQLLAFSRKQVCRICLLDLNRIVADTERLLHRTLGENINLVTIPGENLGAVEADRGQIEQVIMNLALNARDAMPGGGNLTIETSKVTVYPGETPIMGMQAGDYILLVVKDTGIGMSPEAREHAFEPFFTSKEEGRNVGLGLAMVYGIVHQCGGWVDLLSMPGKGTEVRVFLPRAEGVPEPVGVAPEHEVARGSETVLLVEDEDSVRHLATRILSSLGYKVLEARNGLDALRLCQEYGSTIDLVLTDVIMPLMGGPELVKQLRGTRNEFRVLYVTGFTERNVFDSSVADPQCQLILKPYTREALARQVRQVLDSE